MIELCDFDFGLCYAILSVLLPCHREFRIEYEDVPLTVSGYGLVERFALSIQGKVGEFIRDLQSLEIFDVIQLIGEGSGILARDTRKRGCAGEIHGSCRIGVESAQVGAALAFYESEIVEAVHAALYNEGAVFDSK